ncbi:hypothetical protein [Hyalangium gracile]|uniref:hypothetical protein n=1 Tax=Hyalangium gracile TaxID=394092 RepID=UPI001CC8EF3C|nr:hypothetical protein [Hyalangium gracile]
MRIPRSMLDYYLDNVTVGFFNDHDSPPDDLSGYHDDVMIMRQKAVRHGDMEFLRLGLGYLLSTPGIDHESWGGGRYPFDAEEVRAIIEYAYQTLWPGAPLPSRDELSQVELVSMPLEEWWAKRG